MATEKIGGLIFCFILLFVIIDTYRAKIAIQKLTGFCLIIFRVIHLSFGLMFFSAGILCLLTNYSFSYYLEYFSFFCCLIGGFGIIFWNFNNCSKK